MPPVSTTPAANFATSSPCAVDTGGKFATGVNDTGGKFAAGVYDAGGKLPPVSTTPAANFATSFPSVVDTGGKSVSPQPQSIPLGPFRIFSKIRGDIHSKTLTTGVVDTGGKCEKKSKSLHPNAQCTLYIYNMRQITMKNTY